MGRRKFDIINGGKSIPITELPLFRATGEELLEQKVEDAPQLEIVNDLHNFGVTAESLNPFLYKIPVERRKPIDDRLNGYALEKAVLGVHNVESLDGQFGVPFPALARMNTPEILALYIGIQQRKYDRAISTTTHLFDETVDLGRTDFPRLMSELVQTGYKYRGVHAMAKEGKGFFSFPTAPGDLIERMQGIPPEDREKFIQSLLLKRRTFGERTKELNYEFRNPFAPGEERYDDTGKRTWIKKIVMAMGLVYRSHSDSYVVVPDELVDQTLSTNVDRIFDRHGKQIPLERFKQELKQRLGFEKDPTYTLPRMFMPKILTGEIEEIRAQFKSDIYLIRDGVIYQPKKSAQH